MISHRLMVEGTSREPVNFYGDNLISDFREIELRKKLLVVQIILYKSFTNQDKITLAYFWFSLGNRPICARIDL